MEIYNKSRVVLMSIIGVIMLTGCNIQKIYRYPEVNIEILKSSLSEEQSYLVEDRQWEVLYTVTEDYKQEVLVNIVSSYDNVYERFTVTYNNNTGEIVKVEVTSYDESF